MHWWHAVEAVNDDLNVTFARVFATPLRYVGDVRLANVRFTARAAVAAMLMSSMRAHRPKGRKQLVRQLGFIVAGLPAALLARPGRHPCSARWGGRGSNPRPRDYESPALTTELPPRWPRPTVWLRGWGSNPRPTD